jgi:hypothetical protein
MAKLITRTDVDRSGKERVADFRVGDNFQLQTDEITMTQNKISQKSRRNNRRKQ